MNFDLKKPCDGCPFVAKRKHYGWLGQHRAEEAIECIVHNQGAFTCHKTDRGSSERAQHCAGAMIMLEHMGKPNQLMRIAEKTGCYDRKRLAMDANLVVTNAEDFIVLHTK